MKRLLTIFNFCFLLTALSAQDRSQAFTQQNDIQPIVMNGEIILPFAFAGGLNNCQYGKIDLNLDGIEDFIVFDKHGNKILPFIVDTDNCSYIFSPQYVNDLPELNHWMNLIDFDRDGKADIFTYTTGGIKVFRNISDNELGFRQVTFPYLKSKQGAAYTNILVTTADYPALTDIDNDGDIDVLSFWGLGSFVEWHKNLSVEKYGIPDSLDFEKVTSCWGHFSEGIESNKINLDTCPNEKMFGLKNSKHTGSTMLVNDFSGDELPDLVLGDVDYPGLLLLVNGGSTDHARIVSYTGNFPDAVNPVQLPSFPLVSKLDINCDGLDDLLVSSFDATLSASTGIENQWLYEGNEDGWNLRTKSFLQELMIDLGAGAYPLIFDYNHDNLPDLLVGNHGRADTCFFNIFNGMKCYFRSSLAMFKNVGTLENPEFQLIDTDFAGLEHYAFESLVPATADMDNDGDNDLVCGSASGRLIYLENIALPGAEDNFIMRDSSFMSIDAGDFSAPILYDFNKDGLFDLIIGNRSGRLSYYRNSGTREEPDFTLVSENLGGVDVREYELSYHGYSVPQMVTFGNKDLLFIGSESGDVFVYDSVDTEHSEEFFLRTRLNLNSGWRSSVTSGLINNDTLPDIFVGNFSGGIQYFGGLKEKTLSFPEESNDKNPEFDIYPNPASDQIMITIGGIKNISGLLQISSISGKIIQTTDIEDLNNPLKLEIQESGIYIITFIPESSLKIRNPLRSKLLVIR